MSKICEDLHTRIRDWPMYGFPFDDKAMPHNGIYILFEKSEQGHGDKRIVRIGTHTGDNQLRSRLKQHFINENKDRSIFRKNIGRCLLSKSNDEYLKIWELDLTTRANKDKYGHLVNIAYKAEIESNVSRYIQDNFTFTVIGINTKQSRIDYESKLISTVSLCNDCKPSNSWLGLHSPKAKIKECGLWQVNELYKDPFNKNTLEHFLTLGA